MDRSQALALVNQYTSNKNLVKHMLAVEAAMVAYAKKFGEDEQKWSVCGIVHDFDYEKMGKEHPSNWGMEELRKVGVEQDIIDAILGHGERLKPETRKDRMAKALFAVDELTGFIVACALVRPDRLAGVTVESVKKTFKKKEFAKGVSREDIEQGAKELGVDMDEHVSVVLEAMKGISKELGL